MRSIVSALSGVLKPRSWMLVVLFALLCVASLGASLYAYTDQPLPVGADRVLPGAAAPAPQAPMGANDCAACHGRPNPAADIYLAVDGSPVGAGQVITKSAGDSFEVDFHFRGMLGDPRRFQGVGAQITLPVAQPAWRIAAGGPAAPAGWSPEGDAGSFWSPAWSRGASAEGKDRTQWTPARDRPNAFHLALGAPPLKPDWAPVVFADRGPDDPADRDGVADHMGADATIGIPAAAPPGRYDLVVGGVGHDGRGNRAMVSASLTISVVARGPRPSPTPRPLTGAQLYRNNCQKCHPERPVQQLYQLVARKPVDALARAIVDGVGEMPPQGAAKGGRLSDADVAAVLEYLARRVLTGQGSGKGGPDVPHTVRSRLDCYACHDRGGLRPIPSDHTRYSSTSACSICHKALTRGAPDINHTVGSGDDCLGCHAPDNTRGAKPVSAAHGDRGSSTCLACHTDLPLASVIAKATPGVAVPTPNPAAQGRPPVVTHTLEGRAACLVCHDMLDGMRPMPSSHLGRSQLSCQGCHKAGTPGSRSDFIPVPDGAPAPPMAHDVQGLTACTTCHAEYDGLRPMPAATHAGRTDLSCLGCHRPGGGAPAPTPDSGAQGPSTSQ